MTTHTGTLSVESYRWRLFILLLVSFAAAILGDSTSEALLLAHFSPAIIPGMFFVNALFLVFSSAFVVSAIDRIDRGLFYILFCLVHAAMLVIIRLALLFDATVVFLPLFSYAYVSKILCFTLFWTLANDLIDSRQAGRLFPFVAAGGTLGAIGVSFSIPWLLKVIDARNLLIVWAAIVGASILLFLPLYRSCGTAFRPSADGRRAAGGRLSARINDLKMVRNEPLLWNMSIFYFMLFFILLNQHYVFYGQIRQRFADANRLASFLGYFNGISMFITLFLQFSCAGHVLKKAGATRAMILMPSILFIVYAVLSGLGIRGASSEMIFGVVVLGMSVRIAFFDSFFSPNFQLFFSSLPQNIRGRGKMALEGVVKPASMIVASLYLILVAGRIPMTANMIVLFSICALLIAQTLRIKREYAGSLVSFLTSVRADGAGFAEGFRELGGEGGFLKAMERILQRENDEIKAYVITILADVNSEQSIAVLKKRYVQADLRERSSIISSIGRKNPDAHREFLLRALDEPDSRIIANAVEGLGSCENRDGLDGLLEPFLHHENNRVRANAIVALWPPAAQRRRIALEERLASMLAGKEPLEKASALYALGRISAPVFEVYLARFAGNDNEIQGNESIFRQFVFACSRTGTAQSLGLLLALAGKSGPRRRKHIATALARAAKKDSGMAILVETIPEPDCRTRAVVLGAIMETGLQLNGDQEIVVAGAALDEIAAIYREWQALETLASGTMTAGLDLLMGAIRDCLIESRLNNVIYCTAILDGGGRIRRIVNRLNHPNRHVRARAYELLDNVGNVRLNRRLVELLEHDDASRHAARARASYGLQREAPDAVLRRYGAHTDELIGQCAVYAMAESKAQAARGERQAPEGAIY